MAQCKNFLPFSARKHIYTSLVHSHLNWGSTLFGATKVNNLKNLESLQNKAIRNLANAKYISHADPIYKNLNILKLRDQININHVLTAHKFKYSRLPDTLDLFFKYNSETESRHLRTDDGNFSIPAKASLVNPVLPIPEILKAWNKLPYSLKCIAKEKTFSKETKQLYFENYELICSNTNCYSCSVSN